ncbi:hypothetical protein KGO95_00215 [Patescibacteria group bacterium]|nr:hypothetical protein [Patescibacteria group bacterium]
MRSLRTILLSLFLISLAGLAFSGVLSYQELWGGTGISCPAPGAPGTVGGYPACVYGFFMYLLLALIAGRGVMLSRRWSEKGEPLP